jgi:Tol biopolymer transport system component
MNADGSGRKQLTDFEATSFYPSLSPDGDTIYFVSRQTGNYEIYSMNLMAGISAMPTCVVRLVSVEQRIMLS